MRFLTCAIITVSSISLAHAEVSDKIPSIPGMWIWGGICLAASVVSLRYLRAWLGGVIALAALYISSTGLWVINHATIGPAAIKEQGPGYIISAIGSAFLPCLGIAVGLFWRWIAETRASGKRRNHPGLAQGAREPAERPGLRSQRLPVGR